MKLLSKLLYISLFIAGYLFSVLFLCIGLYLKGDKGIFFALIGLYFLTPLIFVISVLTYRMWSSIQDIYARTTPIKAVLLLFIPVFNIYWMYQVLIGFTEDYNSFISRNEIETPPLRDDLLKIFFFLTVMSLIPFVGVLPYFINIVFGSLMISEIYDAVYGVKSVLSERTKGLVKARI